MYKSISILFLIIQLNCYHARPNSVRADVPEPSPAAAECNEKISKSSLSQSCAFTGMSQLFRHIEKSKDEQSPGAHECCDFDKFLSCYERKAPLVCTTTEVTELGQFFDSTLKYLKQYRCPGFSLANCSQFDQDEIDSLDQTLDNEDLVAQAMEKFQNNQDYLECMDSLIDDNFCLSQRNGILCREQSMNKVCSPEEVSAIKRFNEQYVHILNTGVCRGDPIVLNPSN